MHESEAPDSQTKESIKAQIVKINQQLAALDEQAELLEDAVRSAEATGGVEVEQKILNTSMQYHQLEEQRVALLKQLQK
jgi:type II secretory pathway component PulM